MLEGLSSVDGITPVPVAVNPATGALLTSGGGSSGGTQYAEGTTTTPATGNVGLGRFNSTPVTVANGALNAMAIDANANTIVVGGVPQTATTANTTQGMVLTGGGVQSSTFSISATGTSTVLDAGNFGSISIYVNTLTSGTITFQSSNDNVNWITKALVPTNGIFAPVTATTFPSSIFTGSLGERYFRLSYSGAGTTTGTVILKNAPTSYNSLTASQNGTWTVGSNSADGSAQPANVFAIGAKSGSNLASIQMIGSLGDASAGSFYVAVAQGIYNGSTYDRVRSGPTTGSVLVSAPTATSSAVPPNAFYMGIRNSASNLQAPVTSGFVTGVTNENGLLVAPGLNNGSTLDVQKNNTSVVVVAAGTTSTQTGVTLTTYNARSLVLAVNITAGAGTLTVAISGSTTSGYTYPILTSTALTGIADNTLRVFPGATPASNTAANDALPRTLSITYTVVGSITFGSDAVLSV